MRIKLVKNKQSELILKAKGDQSWKELSKKINLVENYLRAELGK